MSVRINTEYVQNFAIGICRQLDSLRTVHTCETGFKGYVGS